MPSKHRRAGNLIAIEMQDRQHGAVAGRIDEVDAFPAAGQRPGLCLTVADNRGDEKIRLSMTAPKAWTST